MFQRKRKSEAQKTGGRVRDIDFSVLLAPDQCLARLDERGVLRKRLEMPGGMWVDVDTLRSPVPDERALRLVRFEGYLLPEGGRTRVMGAIVPRSWHETIPIGLAIGAIVWVVPVLSGEMAAAPIIAWTLLWGGLLGALAYVYGQYRGRRQVQLDAMRDWLRRLLDGPGGEPVTGPPPGP